MMMLGRASAYASFSRSERPWQVRMDWHGVKLLLVEATGVSRDALHVLGGVGGQFLLVLLLRRRWPARFPGG